MSRHGRLPRADRLALVLEARQRARRILRRVNFVAPDESRRLDAAGRSGHYASACLNLGYLLALAYPLPPDLRRKLNPWITAVHEAQREWFVVLAPLGSRHVSKAYLEECVQSLRRREPTR
jgi:hypothetical protein